MQSMADDIGTVTGTRDDLVIDASRCLRMRFSESSCRRCLDSCPHGAVSLESGLALDPSRCRGCLLCTSACPAGALEQNSDFSAILSKLSRVPEPVLGCFRARERSNATLACLGGLSEEHLLALYHTVPGRLTLNLSLCRDCPNSPMATRLKQRLNSLAIAYLDSGSCHIEVAESAQDIRYREVAVDRRGFLKSFRTSLFSSAAAILSSSGGQAERRTEYAGKRLPHRRELLNRIRGNASQELAERMGRRFDSQVSIDENCTACQGCVAICPTGALTTEDPGTPPVFERLNCSGCGLCREFCLDGALRILPGCSTYE